jgi:hypothetical protein
MRGSAHRVSLGLMKLVLFGAGDHALAHVRGPEQDARPRARVPVAC